MYLVVIELSNKVHEGNIQIFHYRDLNEAFKMMNIFVGESKHIYQIKDYSRTELIY